MKPHNLRASLRIPVQAGAGALLGTYSLPPELNLLK